MLLLLPPSETKAPTPARGRPTCPDSLSFPELSSSRRAVFSALQAASARGDALELLGVGASLAHEVAANLSLDLAPAVPVERLYTGVLYDALGLSTLSGTALRRARSSIVIVSALWGALRLRDAVAPYRLAMGVTLPLLGPLASHWRPALESALGGPRALAGGQAPLIVDCRSTSYVAAWPLRGPHLGTAVSVRVFRQTQGRRIVVSHQAKHTRGVIARRLLLAPEAPQSIQDVARAAAGDDLDVELTAPSRPGAPWLLDVITA